MPLRALAFLMTALAASAGVAAAQETRPRAVVELFTSQGCSSCPPADKVLADLARDPSLIALSLSIDYWDYLGWRDTLAAPGNTARQKAYAKVRGDRLIYTPQMVVNGVTQVQGSDRAAVDRVLAEAKKTALVPVTARMAGDRIEITIAAGDAAGGADIWLCPVSRSVPVEIARGENKGHTLTYANVVRGWVRLGAWDGKAVSLTAAWPEVAVDGADAVAVIVQQGAEKPARILGAALLSR